MVPSASLKSRDQDKLPRVNCIQLGRSESDLIRQRCKSHCFTRGHSRYIRSRNGKEEGAGTKKVETDEDGEPAPGSRETPREATPPGEPEEAQQEAGGGEDGKEDRAEDGPGPERRTGRRGGKNPGHRWPPQSAVRSHTWVGLRPSWPEKVFSLIHILF